MVQGTTFDFLHSKGSFFRSISNVGIGIRVARKNVGNFRFPYSPKGDNNFNKVDYTDTVSFNITKKVQKKIGNEAFELYDDVNEDTNLVFSRDNYHVNRQDTLDDAGTLKKDVQTAVNVPDGIIY